VTESCSCFILAGGKSTRFGTNKSLALVGDQYMALVVAKNLQSAFGNAARLIGADEKTSSELGLESVVGTREGNGPLAAIIDAMESTTSTFVAFAPNDTPFFTAHNYAALLAKLEDSKADVVVATDATDASQAHWLLSIWRKSSCMPILTKEFERGVRSVHGAVTELQVATVAFDAAAVRNINTVSDLLNRGTI
jgi:molybdopterin-guanine dinucleotide biosynthesis protein A